ncbi:MAG: hypothetical protein J5640_02250 [Bacteroidales bacterium]|nr:hypothetical protein [Bacteroidales bacterium]
MKKSLFIAAFALAAVFSACQVKESLEIPAAPDGVKMIKVKAVLADGELTKTTLDEGSLSFHWSEADSLVAWDGTNVKRQCAITDIDEKGVATFEVPENTQWVIYPSRKLVVTDNTATWSRSTSQKISEEGSELIGDGGNPMFGRLEGGVIKFTNLCGYIQFQLTGSKTINRLSFKTNNITSPALTGDATIDVSAASPVLSYPVLSKVSTSGVSKHAYINVYGRGIPLSSTPTSVYVVVPPATYETSELVLEFTDGTAAALVASNDITVERNKVRKIKPIDTDALFPADPEPLDVAGQSNCYMVIAGPEAKHYGFTAKKCVSGETFDLAKMASLLWSESKTLIRSTTYDANTHQVTFLYGGGNEKGNAVISLDQNQLGVGATLLWNYHIWVTDQPENILMDETDMPQAILDRNVGATWAPKTEAEVTNMTEEQWLETIGTYYQYGNHIPYPRLKTPKNSTAAWDNYRMEVMYGFSNYCHRFAHSGSAKATLAEQEQFPNYAYHKGTGVKYGSANETVWTLVVLKGGPTGEEGENIWYVNNTATEKTNDYDPCPQGYCFITATYTYQETLNNEVTDHLLNGNYAGKYNMDISSHLMYFPAAGYLGNGKYALVGGGQTGGRVVYWSYYSDTKTDMDHKFRRNFMNQAQTKFSFDNQPFSSQAHNMRCRVLSAD